MPYSHRRRSTIVAVLTSVLLGTTASVALVPASAASRASSATLGSRSLRQGASGADVKQLQKLLRAVGLKISRIDGQFGAQTTAAVKQFQTAANLLPASGAVGPKTVQALKQAALGGAANTAAGGYDPDSGAMSSQSLGDRIPLKQGMSGHDVKVLQDFLTRAGDNTTVDGQFGKGTTAAMKAFEQANGLTVDGVVSADDIAVLRGQVDAGPNAASAAAPQPLAPGDKAVLNSDGTATAPASAPPAVQAMIAAGNKIAFTPYIYGGGHGKWEDKGYDCSGSVSYVLHAAGLLDTSLTSGDFMSWGTPGPGQWVTMYANEGHIYAIIAGLRFDTSGADEDGSRWHSSTRPTKGYTVVHPTGL